MRIQELESIVSNDEAITCDEALCLLLHSIMVKAGYDVYCKSEEEKQQQEYLGLPIGWRTNKAVYKFNYKHKLCEDGNFVLVCVPLGASIIINGVCENVAIQQSSAMKIQTKTSLYVTKPNKKIVFTQSTKLYTLFRDTITYPLLHSTRAALDLPPVHGLMALPYEIQVNIIKHLDVQTVIQLSIVCQHMLIVCKDPTIWRNLYLKNFNDASDTSLSQDWYLLYKESHQKQRLNRRQAPRMPYTNEAPYSLPPYVQPPPPNWPGGIIGGDYDKDPTYSGGVGPMFPHRPRIRFDPIGPPGMPPFRPGRGGGMIDDPTGPPRLGLIDDPSGPPAMAPLPRPRVLGPRMTPPRLGRGGGMFSGGGGGGFGFI